MDGVALLQAADASQVRPFMDLYGPFLFLHGPFMVLYGPFMALSWPFYGPFMALHGPLCPLRRALSNPRLITDTSQVPPLARLEDLSLPHIQARQPVSLVGAAFGPPGWRSSHQRSGAPTPSPTLIHAPMRLLAHARMRPPAGPNVRRRAVHVPQPLPPHGETLSSPYLGPI